MAEEWKLESVERRLTSLEKSVERDRERAREAKEEERDRRFKLIGWIFWTVYIAAITTMVVLAVAGKVHHQ